MYSTNGEFGEGAHSFPFFISFSTDSRFEINLTIIDILTTGKDRIGKLKTEISEDGSKFEMACRCKTRMEMHAYVHISYFVI